MLHNFSILLILATLNSPSFLPTQLTPEQVYYHIKDLGIQHPKIVYAQYVQESGKGRSYAARKKNNLFGFMSKGRIMSFESQYSCIQYYKKWQDKRYKGGDYYKFLVDINYASDSLYTERLKRIVKTERI